jgi:hypothetical protein
MPPWARTPGVKITFFAPTVVGYIAYPDALYVRGLAQALGERGHSVRVVEPRQNHAFASTLRAVGAAAARQFHADFTGFQHHTFEPSTGGRLLEWVTREVALIDAAVVVEGLDDELTRWLANVSRPGLQRAYWTLHPDALTDELAVRLQLTLFDAVLAPSEPAADLPWRRVCRTVAAADESRGLTELATERWTDNSTAVDALLVAVGGAATDAQRTSRQNVG